jgi:hypothetical protein
MSMRRSPFSLSLVGIVSLAVGLTLTTPLQTAVAQEPSPRPPLSATDQYLTSIAPQPTQPSSGGGGTAIPTSGPAQPSATATPVRLRATATATPSPSATHTATSVPPTVTPGPTDTPVVIVQTVVQTVVIVATEQASASTPTATPPPTEAPAAGPVEPPVGGWLWLLLLLPFLALLVALWWLAGRDFLLPGFYPLRGRPRRAGRLSGRGPRRRPDLPV